MNMLWSLQNREPSHLRVLLHGLHVCSDAAW
jgi:hypothetical protein